MQVHYGVREEGENYEDERWDHDEGGSCDDEPDDLDEDGRDPASNDTARSVLNTHPPQINTKSTRGLWSRIMMSTKLFVMCQIN